MDKKTIIIAKQNRKFLTKDYGDIINNNRHFYDCGQKTVFDLQYNRNTNIRREYYDE